MSDPKYKVEETDFEEGYFEYDGADYSGQIMTANDDGEEYIRVLCIDGDDARHIAKLLEANPFPE